MSELTRHIEVQKNEWEDEEEASRAASCASASLQRVKESRWQQQTGAEGRSVRPRRRETSRRLPRGQNRSTRRNIKKQYTLPQRAEAKGNGASGVFEHIVPSHAWQNDVTASVYNAWQISPFCRTPVEGAFVLDGANGYHDKSSRALSDKHKVELIRYQT